LADPDRTPEIPVSTAGLGSRALRNTVLVLAAKVVALANAEDLPAHGEAITARFAGEAK